ncbi:DMT family transporter [Leptothermofonsia sp. ETS-13]|uniref:DMT family transporter n=1 Tax=Leptothermofonsia sp. ETS-13 TaxID=3035696 RepID=UPI003BA27FA9
MFYRIPKQLYLWLAVLIFGAASSVTRKLTELGAQNSVDGHNPISLCNVLFVGNLCALIVFITLFWQQWSWSNLKQLSRKEWLGLVAVALFSGALAPSLIFQALATTNVNGVVLVGRLEPPLTLALSVWLLGEWVNRWEVAGAIASFIGVALTILFQPSTARMLNMGGFMIGVGELLTAAGAVALAVATILGKRYLGRVPLGIFSIFRTALGTVIFFFTALLLFGKDHFMEAFSPFLWKWMLLYGTVIVVMGQTFWVTGLRASTISMASLAASFTPIAGIAAAYLLLGETPTHAQYIGGSVILMGIFLSHIGIQQKMPVTAAESRVQSTSTEREIIRAIGFKGI